MGESRKERALNTLKQIRHLKRKKQLEEAKTRLTMGEVAYEAMLHQKAKKTITEELTTALWDFEKNQYPMAKYGVLHDLIKTRLKQLEGIESEEKNKLKSIYNKLIV